ncbi:hypothetical protein SDC9_171719 [bioreactor metagenome]|uniref:Uncharacterized protein n=1 Tax=bioreactor metagenome TaxID=1076179 RepID=A0A645GE84_9ZZZZ
MSNIGINPLYTTGDYSLSTSNVKNDTLNLPGSGIYHIDISLIPSFVYASPPPSFGSSYQILLNVVDEANSIITSLVYEGIIPNDADTSAAEVLLSKAFIYNTKSTNPGVKIILSQFNYAYAFENQLAIESLILVVQKWQKP